MNIHSLHINSESILEEKTESVFKNFKNLISELNQKDLSDGIISAINNEIEDLNVLLESQTITINNAKTSLNRIISLVEKETKFVPKNYYQKQWLALGMAVFGVPFGMLFGLSLDNMAFLGLGLPIGMAIGIAIGTDLDKKAAENGKQLNLEIQN